ncbi:hypothetical protein UA08_02580 [Talaromyces atroroseus]|uniref:Uncharacterized protein n=1 Tax=Talaromyces atroroseus TaxID=1441469 RepID=A0A225ASG7_TALAT|nr:hypothetical protein UA08_02580 [Talaromyces atroroseus]OKL62443.1 hypothetical protein UA08_02580 [Talaromyces atroroseus]
MAYSAADIRRVYLACRPIFAGNNAFLRKTRKIRKLVSIHQASLRPLLQDFAFEKVVDIIRTLLEKRIFQSDVEAKIEFPELSHSSPARDVQRAASENDAARSAAEALEEVASREEGNESDDERPTSVVHLAHDAANGKNSKKFPHYAFKLGEASLNEILFATHKLRHTAVHRLPTTCRGVEALIKSAIILAETLQDPLRTAQLEDLRLDIDSKIKAMELNKNVLEDTLSQELQKIQRQREELDRQEKDLTARIIREDRENKFLIGSLLEDSVNRFFLDARTMVNGSPDDADQVSDAEEKQISTTDCAEEDRLLVVALATVSEQREDKDVGDARENDGVVFREATVLFDIIDKLVCF